MSRIKLTNNQRNWVLVMLLIILPLIVTHYADEKTVPRLVSTLIMTSFVPITCFVIAISPKISVFRSAPRLKGKYSDEILKKWDIGIKIFLLVVAIWFFVSLTLPVLGGTYKIYVNHEEFHFIESSVKERTSALGLFFVGYSLKLDGYDESYLLLYPTNAFRSADRFRFKLLPDSNIILDSTKL